MLPFCTDLCRRSARERGGAVATGTYPPAPCNGESPVFLTLTDILGTLAVFGDGRAADAQHHIAPAVTVLLYCWGDMDVHIPVPG